MEGPTAIQIWAETVFWIIIIAIVAGIGLTVLGTIIFLPNNPVQWQGYLATNPLVNKIHQGAELHERLLCNQDSQHQNRFREHFDTDATNHVKQSYGLLPQWPVRKTQTQV